MNSKTQLFFLVLAGCSLLFGQGATLTVDASRPGTPISPMLYGMFFEEINHAGDGGLYAEMVRNRTLAEQTTVGWSLRNTGAAESRMGLDTSRPLNAANRTSLRVDISSVGTGGQVAVVNEGWWGMGLRQGKTYNLSFFARAGASFHGDLEARLESAAGKIYASQKVSGLA